MSKQVKNFEQLKDSRLLYDKQIPKFGYFIITSVLFLLIFIIVWSVNTPKTYIIKSNGTIQSTNKEYIMSAYAGEIASINISEGRNVNKGDILFTVKSSDLDLQELQAKGQREIYKKQISQMELLEKSIKENTNYFDDNKEEDREYYNQYETYISQVMQNQFDDSTYHAYGYSKEQIETEAKKYEEKIAEIYYSTLQNIEKSKKEVQTKIDDLEIQLNAISNGQSEYQVTAKDSGIVHMFGDYKEGMVVQAAATVASIAKENDQYVVQASVDISDITRIKLGDKVDMVVSGLDQSIYGTITGEIASIDSDSTTINNNEKSHSFFKITILPDIDYLVSKDGNKVNISNGLAVEARIQYKEISYFNYVMKALGILT